MIPPGGSSAVQKTPSGPYVDGSLPVQSPSAAVMPRVCDDGGAAGPLCVVVVTSLDPQLLTAGVLLVENVGLSQPVAADRPDAVLPAPCTKAQGRQPAHGSPAVLQAAVVHLEKPGVQFGDSVLPSASKKVPPQVLAEMP